MKNQKKFPKQGIVWNQGNEMLLKKYIAESQKRARIRTCDIGDFRYLLRRIDNSVAMTEMSKKVKRGMTFALDPQARDFPKGYYKKGTPKSTQMYVRFNGRNWTVKGIGRKETGSKQINQINVLTDNQKSNILYSAIDNI